MMTYKIRIKIFKDLKISGENEEEILNKALMRIMAINRGDDVWLESYEKIE